MVFMCLVRQLECEIILCSPKSRLQDAGVSWRMANGHVRERPLSRVKM